MKLPTDANATGSTEGPARRPPGFRFSAADGLLLVLAAGATWWMWGRYGDLAMIVPIVVGHFFLFCNVFRVRRSYELAWAAAFVVAVLASLADGDFGWAGVLVALTPVTAAVVLAEMWGPRYHGLGHSWINRNRTADRPGETT